MQKSMEDFFESKANPKKRKNSASSGDEINGATERISSAKAKSNPNSDSSNVIQNTDSEQKTSLNEIDMTSENGEGSQNIPETLESPIEAEEKVEDMTNNGDHTCSDATIVSCSAAHEEINSSNSFTGGCPFENLFTCPEETPHDFNKPSHKILLDVDALAQGIAVPYPKNLVDKWTQGHVRVPCVSKCLLRVPNPTPNARPAFVFSKKSHWSEVKVG